MCCCGCVVITQKLQKLQPQLKLTNIVGVIECRLKAESTRWSAYFAETSAATWRMVVNYCYPINNALGGENIEADRGRGSGSPPKFNQLFLGPRHTSPEKFIKNPFITF